MRHKQFKANGWWKTEADCDVCRWPSNSRWTKHYKIFLSIFFQFKSFYVYDLFYLILFLCCLIHYTSYFMMWFIVGLTHDKILKNIKSKLSRKFLHSLWVIKLLFILGCREQGYRWMKFESQYVRVSNLLPWSELNYYIGQK